MTSSPPPLPTTDSTPAQAHQRARCTLASIGRVLVIDHADSFVYNLVQLIGTLGAEPIVMRHDRTDLPTLLAREADCNAVVLSPGPGHPRSLALSRALIDHLARQAIAKPVLGVCLGHQLLGIWLGAQVERATHPLHGQAVPIYHQRQSIFSAQPTPLRVARYNSLTVQRPWPDRLIPLAWSEDDELMALQVRGLPWFGVQFHPESYLSELGVPLVAAALTSSPVLANPHAPTGSNPRLAPATDHQSFRHLE